MAIDDERERRIQEMERAGMPRQEAEFAVAIERGEVVGDVIQVDDDSDPNSDQDIQA